MYIRIAKEEMDRLPVQSIIVVGRAANPSTKTLREEIKRQQARAAVIFEPLEANPAPPNEYLQALRSAIEEAVRGNYQTVAIPVAPAAFTDLPEEIIPGVVVGAVNGANDCLLKTLVASHSNETVNEIILIAASDNIAKGLDAKLSQKRRWSRARMLSFVLDALDLQFNRTALCERHFIHGGHFKRYLNTFSHECRKELEEKYSNLLFQRYAEHKPAIIEIMERMTSLSKLMKKVPLNTLTNYLDDTTRVLWPGKAYFVDSLMEFFEYCDPLFHYISQLIPYEEFNDLSKRRKQPMRSKQEVRNQHAHLESRIGKIMELQDTIFPIHLLEKFWDQWIWRQIDLPPKNWSRFCDSVVA